LETAAGNASVDDYAAQQKKVEGIVVPIMAKLHGQPNDAPNDAPHSDKGPSVEEVD